MMELNIPEVVRELTSAFEAYERALQANDIEGLNVLFWDSPHTLRYGVKELLYSHAEIARFRRERGPVDQRRSLRNTRITTFGRDFGVANTEYVPFGSGSRRPAEPDLGAHRRGLENRQRACFVSRHS